MFKVNFKDTRTTPGVALVSLLSTLTYFTPCSSVSIVNLEQVNAGWVLHVCGGPRATLQQINWLVSIHPRLLFKNYSKCQKLFFSPKQLRSLTILCWNLLLRDFQTSKYTSGSWIFNSGINLIRSAKHTAYCFIMSGWPKTRPLLWCATNAYVWKLNIFLKIKSS